MAAESEALPRWVKGEWPGAAKLNGPVDWINSRGYSHEGPFEDWTPRPFLAVIVSAGPNGEADLTGPMYWVQESEAAFSSATSNDYPTLIPNRDSQANVDPGATGPENIHPALNLAEADTRSHTLGAGQAVWVFPFYDIGSGDDAPTLRFAFGRAPSSALFGVSVTKDGGQNGDQTRPATWTYTVYRVGTTTNPLGRGVGVAKPRPKGLMNYGGNYGVAFYAGNTLVLWDAGEYEDTGAGCDGTT